MKRRRLLRGLSTAGALAIAGCVVDGSPGGPDTDAPTDSTTPTVSATPTDSASSTDTATPTAGDSPADTDTPTEKPVDARGTDEYGSTDSPPGESTSTPTDSASGESGERDDVTEPDPGGANGDHRSDDSTPSPPSATPSEVVDRSFDVLDSGCGTQLDDATVSFDGGVAVSGTIWGNDACYTASLMSGSLSTESLTVVVVAERDDDGGAICAECISEIEYEASFSFDGPLPEEVTVVHVHGEERTVVTEATR